MEHGIVVPTKDTRQLVESISGGRRRCLSIFRTGGCEASLITRTAAPLAPPTRQICSPWERQRPGVVNVSMEKSSGAERSRKKWQINSQLTGAFTNQIKFDNNSTECPNFMKFTSKVDQRVFNFNLKFQFDTSTPRVRNESCCNWQHGGWRCNVSFKFDNKSTECH